MPASPLPDGSVRVAAKLGNFGEVEVPTDRSPCPVQAADKVLMQRVARGDEAAFATVYDRVAPLLFSVIFQILQNGRDAEDALQETFIKIWKKAAEYRGDRGTISAWAVMIARCKAIDKLRSRHRYALATRSAALEHLFKSGEWTDETHRASQWEDRDRIRAALRRIDDRQREALLLAFFTGLTHMQIAQRLNVPLGTVKARIRRGLFSLREALRRSACEV